MEATLLVELLTEELPPKELHVLSEAFSSALAYELNLNGFLPHNVQVRNYATPRRIAAQIPRTLRRSPDVEWDVLGPSTKAPSEAIAGFARKNGVPVEKLERRTTPKGEVFVARKPVEGNSLDEVLAGKVEAALKTLRFRRAMRWGDGDALFVRPVHGLVMLHGSRIVPGKVLGLESGNRTRGHRFMGAAEVPIGGADEYEKKLLDEGKVIADFAVRRKEIERQLAANATKLHSRFSSEPQWLTPQEEFNGLPALDALVDEVTALVEYPAVYVGEFDPSFLEMPQECLILTMRQHQRYFPLFDAAGKLLPKFLIVSNMQLADPRHIVAGNQRVLRPRLADARFFYNQDRKQRLEERVPLLAKVVYHNKLGSQLERITRIENLTKKISRQLETDELLAARAARLCKADLLTGMVGEFPELQGIMGRYYALHDKEPAAVADAIEAHYRPRFAGDRLPEGALACAVALADKLDAIAGLFSIGQPPTGDKDPFGLRRAALGVVRILVENKLHLSLHELAKAAFEPFRSQAPVELVQFVYDRFAGYLKEQGFSTLQIDSVLSMHPTSLAVVLQQLDAVRAFQALPEAESLAAANKRIVNILKQAEAKGESFANAESGELKEPAERALLDAIRSASEKAKALYEKGDYTGYLKSFAVLKAPVDLFFEKVMVMVEDRKLRHSRLALLRDLRESMNRVADISRLAA